MTTFDPASWRSLREIDEATGRTKGTAFRAFRRIESDLREGEDFVVLRADQSDDIRRQVQALRTQGRIYASSVSVILLAPHAAARLRTLVETSR